MENQHRKITGYRELSQGEIDLMNEGKDLAEKVRLYIERLTGMGPIVDQRWVAIARTDLQKGFMAAVRSVAKPDTF